MPTRTSVPHYPPATYYPTILPHSYCTRGWKPPSMKVSSIFAAKTIWMQEMTVQGTKIDIEEEVYTTEEQVDAENCDLHIINWEEDDI